MLRAALIVTVTLTLRRGLNPAMRYSPRGRIDERRRESTRLWLDFTPSNSQPKFSSYRQHFTQRSAFSAVMTTIATQ
jgi:hypothetical protein